MEIPGYEIKGVIGKGGMARVYLARHQALDRNVAIKVLNRQEEADSEFSDRFLREARIVANLSHPGIVTIHDVGEHGGHNYLVMELLPSGETLGDKIKAGVDSEYALSIVRQVATALKVAHERNIVHRDIKPDNIMFRADGSVVLMDFGVARSVDEAATQMTQAGTIIGTPQYISPEQAEGKEVGPYSDIYSLGIVFYEMLTGKVPYAADTPIALVFKHVSEPVPKLTGNLAVYQPLIDRMMAKTREQRYTNCDHIIADIDRIRAGKPAAHAAAISNTAAVKAAGKPASRSAETSPESASSGAADSTYPPTEILRPAATNLAENSAVQATEVLSPEVVRKARAAADNLTIVDKTNTGNDKRKQKAGKHGRKSKADPVTRAGKGRTMAASFLSVALVLLLAGGVYIFGDVDAGKLKTMVGIDPGPVYSRVGRLVSIPDGSFVMGNSSGDSTESPPRTVRIDNFMLGETEVTQKQWRLVMGSAPSYFSDCDDCPVDSVSWNDVQEFLARLNRQTGLHFRLPTEAEWEYACRSAGKDESYCGGEDENKVAWYGDNSGDKTRPVGQKKANDLGLHDMSGNVWEWTQDCWHDSYDGAPSDGQAREDGSCAQRVMRGGSWIGVAGGLRSTGRFQSLPAREGRNIGFRVAQDLPKGEQTYASQ
jgi:serine/threonine protein kinase/formylglycine-generating enzyme required for sulfatase activity